MTTPYGQPKLGNLSESLWTCWSLAVLGLLWTLTASAAEPQGKRVYDVPASDATISLRLFAEQSGLEIIYPAEDVKGVKTNALKGEYTPREAINRLLADTVLTVTSAKSGAIAIRRMNEPKTGGRHHGKDAILGLIRFNQA